MTILKLDRDRLRGALYGKQRMVASQLGIHPHSLSRKLQTGFFSIEELNQMAIALGRNVSDFVIEVEHHVEKAS